MGPIEEAIARLLPGVIAALPPQEERFLRPQEVSDKYGIAVKTVRRLIAENKIPHTGRLVGDPLIPESEFIKFIQDAARANVAR